MTMRWGVGWGKAMDGKCLCVSCSLGSHPGQIRKNRPRRTLSGDYSVYVSCMSTIHLNPFLLSSCSVISSRIHWKSAAMAWCDWAWLLRNEKVLWEYPGGKPDSDQCGQWRRLPGGTGGWDEACTWVRASQVKRGEQGRAGGDKFQGLNESGSPGPSMGHRRGVLSGRWVEWRGASSQTPCILGSGIWIFPEATGEISGKGTVSSAF